MENSTTHAWEDLLRRMETFASLCSAEKAEIEQREGLFQRVLGDARARNREIQNAKEKLSRRIEKIQRTGETLKARRKDYIQAIRKLESEIKSCDSILATEIPGLYEELKKRESRLLIGFSEEFEKLKTGADISAFSTPDGEPPRLSNPVEVETDAGADEFDDIMFNGRSPFPEELSEPAGGPPEFEGPNQSPAKPPKAPDPHEPQQVARNQRNERPDPRSIERPLTLDELLGSVIDQKI
jgi:hypothetical protein